MIKIIGCDFHPGDQADCDVGQGDRRDVGEGAESRKEGGGAGLLRGIAGARARGAGSKRAVAVVRAAAGRIRTRRKTFFARIWVPTPEERDARQLLLRRAKQVRMRSQVKNQLQALALNQGVQRKWKLRSARARRQLENLPLLPWEVSGAGESGHGAEAGSAFVLDAALGSGPRAAVPGFPCRTARVIPWSWLRPCF